MPTSAYGLLILGLFVIAWVASYRLAFPPASPGAPSGPAQGPAAAETADAP